FNLEVGSGPHGSMTARMMEGLEEIFVQMKPGLVIVFGDTNTTLAGALTAVKLHIPLAHVEAGLRSFNRRMPEEINRVLTDHCSSLLLAPTLRAVDNLRQEGFRHFVSDGRFILPHQVNALPEGRPLVVNSGDVMYDAVLAYSDQAQAKSGILRRLNLSPQKYALASIHRAENTDDPERLLSLFTELADLARKWRIVIPLHPRTAAHLKKAGFSPFSSELLLIEPVGYFDMILLEKNASVILTDSGGVQKEAFFFGVPCITLRNETEWTELVERKHNILAGQNSKNISKIFREVYGSYFTPEADLYGDGRASQTIAATVKLFLATKRQ
ncbi:MAG: UDP-N-acetyl glucosamine 2-epimerase, partial [Desulfobacteraceae bacterium]